MDDYLKQGQGVNMALWQLASFSQQGRYQDFGDTKKGGGCRKTSLMGWIGKVEKDRSVGKSRVA